MYFYLYFIKINFIKTKYKIQNLKSQLCSQQMSQKAENAK